MLSEISKATNLAESDITSVLITGPNCAMAEIRMSIDEYEKVSSKKVSRRKFGDDEFFSVVVPWIGGVSRVSVFGLGSKIMSMVDKNGQ